MKRRKNKKNVESLLSIAVATLVGCALVSLCGWWIAAGRVEYWTGSTERHHFVATMDSFAFWALILVLTAGAVALWVFSARAFARWRHYRRVS
jgi:hypothetical protein